MTEVKAIALHLPLITEYIQDLQSRRFNRDDRYHRFVKDLPKECQSGVSAFLDKWNRNIVLTIYERRQNINVQKDTLDRSDLCNICSLKKERKCTQMTRRSVS